MRNPSVHRPPFIFFVGCGRSGTTLLRALFDAHPEVAVTHESRFIPWMLERARRYDGPDGFRVERFVADLEGAGRCPSRFRSWGLPSGDVIGALRASPPSDVAEAIRLTYAVYAAARGKPRFGDKTPSYVLHVDALGAAFPESRIVHIIRDGRDVALALRDVEFGPAGLVQAAWEWRRKITKAQRDGAGLGPDRYREVRYERLVGDPEATVRELCQFVGVDFVPEMFEFHRSRELLARGLGRQRHHGSLAQPIRVGLRDWHTQLEPRAVARYEAVAGDLLAELGYEVVYGARRGPVASVMNAPAVAAGKVRAWIRARRRR